MAPQHGARDVSWIAAILVAGWARGQSRCPLPRLPLLNCRGSCLMYLGSREKHNLPLTPAPRSSRTSRVCRGGPARGRCCPSLAVIPHNHFSLETLSANQTTLPGSCRAAFILFPAWPWANAPKNAVSHPETHSGFAWEETTAPNLNLAHLDQFCLLRRPPGKGRQTFGFLEVSELCHIQIQTQFLRGRLV